MNMARDSSRARGELLGSDVDAALTVLTSHLIERVVHAGVVEVLGGIVRLDTLEDTKGAQGSSDDHSNDNAHDGTRGETDSKDLVLAKGRLLQAALALSTDANVTLGLRGADLEVRHATLDRVAAVVGAE